MAEEQTITIVVDGRELKTRPGAMLIEATDAAGIAVPRFCYHPKLSIAANCRMCLVEVERAPKPLPACATPVADGMIVHTRSPLALAAQKGTMEFLLINHPLDCPICDQGGECELQDVAMGYGSDVSRFSERKRVVADPDIGPLIQTDMTRCIHCTRCVRFGEEIAGVRELGATGRGEHMKIGTYVARTVDSELSGNVIDLCPVGALTSKPFLFKARSWELHQHPSIAPHDSVGANLYVHVRRGEAMRVVPRDNEPVNECWISDRDRYSYEGLGAPERLLRPMIKRDGKWREADWQEALEAAAAALKAAGSELGTLVSPRATLEEAFLAQKITRGLGSGSVDHRLRQGDFRAPDTEPPLAWLGMPITELERVQAALVVGGNPRKEQPLLGHRLRKAARAGASVAYVNPLALDLTYEATQIVAAPSALARELASVGKALGLSGAPFDDAEAGDPHRLVATQLKDAADSAVLIGNLAVAHPDYAVLRGLVYRIAAAADARVGFLLEAANSLGARLAGALPGSGPGGRPAGQPGADAHRLLSQRHKGYLLVDVDPGLDCWDPATAVRTLSAESPVVALSAFRSPSLEACADVLLPMGAFTETSGTFVNAEGRWQSFAGVARPRGEARPGWKVLRVLGNLIDLDGFDHTGSEDVLAEVRSACEGATPDNAVAASEIPQLRYAGAEVERVGEVPIYAADALARHAPALQRTVDGRAARSVRAARVLAERLGVNDGAPVTVVQGEGRLELALSIDDRVPDGCAWVPAGVSGSERLGGQVGDLILEKV